MTSDGDCLIVGFGLGRALDMQYVKFDVVEELEKAVQGRKTLVSRSILLATIAGMLGLSDEMKRRRR
jgi:hypothetical protein